jgi:serine protease AprX
VALALPAAGLADGSSGSGSGGGQAFVPSTLLSDAQANPGKQFNVIVQGDKESNGKRVADRVTNEHGKVKKAFRSIGGAAATISGSDLLKLARDSHVTAITPDVRVRSSEYQNAEMWRQSADIEALWDQPAVKCVTNALGLKLDPTCIATPAVLAPKAPAIAVVDSGIDPTHVADFGGRIVANVNFSSLAPSATGDDEGHGTMVAAIAAGSNPAHPGVAQNAPIVSLRTADREGQSLTSDVIAAVDWILANKGTYNIRVANFSLAGAADTSFRFDPLDRAVEKLWFSGIVVVAAAGNHGEGGAVSMSRAPGNDPFIITVGAVDQNTTADPLDDTIPYWSAYGFTMDGFSKPDLVAPGRFMIAAIPSGASIPATVPDRVVAPGYMWMSGTSFATPVVAGAAAQILARHPEWTPDQVKGALMLTSNYLWGAVDNSAGVGEIDAAAAATLDFTPPDPNENFKPFVVADAASGGLVFDAANWASAVSSSASWSSANWASANWASASWSSANWASASWSSANWSSTGSQALLSQVNWSESTFTP